MSRRFLVPVILPADPTAAMEAATKQYVDGLAGSSLDARYVNVTGDTMTGTLTVPTITGVGGNNSLLVNNNWFPYTDASNYYSAAAHVFRSGANETWLNIYAGQADFSVRVRVPQVGDIALATETHAFQIGPTGSHNVAFDYHRIQSRFQGMTNDLELNPLGGIVRLGGTVALGSLYFSTGPVKILGAPTYLNLHGGPGMYLDADLIQFRNAAATAFVTFQPTLAQFSVPVTVAPGNVAIPLIVQQGVGAAEVNIMTRGDGYHGWLGRFADNSHYKFIMQSDPYTDGGRNLEVIQYNSDSSLSMSVQRWRYDAVQFGAPLYINGGRGTDVGLTIYEKTTTGHAIIEMRAGGWVNYDVKQGGGANRFSLTSNPALEGGRSAQLYVYDPGGVGVNVMNALHYVVAFNVPVNLSGLPTQSYHAASKEYVDGKVVAAPSEVEISASDPIGSNAVAELWYDTAATATPPVATGVSFTPVGTIAATNVQSAIAEVATEAARGVVAWKPGSQAGVAVTASPPVQIFSIAAPLVAGRMYEVFFNCRAHSSNQYFHFTGAVAPSTGAPWVCDAYSYAPTTYGWIEWTGLCICTATATYTFTVTCNTASGGGSIWTDAGGGIRIVDVGPTIAAAP